MLQTDYNGTDLSWMEQETTIIHKVKQSYQFHLKLPQTEFILVNWNQENYWDLLINFKSLIQLELKTEFKKFTMGD